MFKKFTAAVVLGAIVGAVAYKIKKEVDDRKRLEEELEMLSAEESSCECDCQEECDCESECSCEKEEKVEEPEEVEEEEDIKEIIYDLVEEAQEKVEEVKEEVQEIVEEIKEEIKEKVDEIQEEIQENPVIEETIEKKTAFWKNLFKKTH